MNNKEGAANISPELTTSLILRSKRISLKAHSKLLFFWYLVTKTINVHIICKYVYLMFLCFGNVKTIFTMPIKLS